MREEREEREERGGGRGAGEFILCSFHLNKKLLGKRVLTGRLGRRLGKTLNAWFSKIKRTQVSVRGKKRKKGVFTPRDDEKDSSLLHPSISQKQNIKKY